jgi:flagellar P-ring protein precursor FlgI
MAMKKTYIDWTYCLRATAAALLMSLCAPLLATADTADNPNRHVLIRDITSVQGVRDNMLVGYGLVVGLSRTGDSQQTYFTVQTLANAMQRMGVLISPGIVEVKNVAAVFITASLPPFARPGSKLDVTVSSAGDAKSLEGGVLLMSSLHGPDGQVYAEAQGSLVVGGYSAGGGANSKQVNTPTVGMVPNGAIVERDTSVDLHDFKVVSLLLRNPDFTTAKHIADAINQDFHKAVASAVDSTRVDVGVADAGESSVPDLISRVQNLALTIQPPARVIVNERTGTIVLGGDVKLTPVSVIHGGLSIEVTTTYAVAPVPGGVATYIPGGGARPAGPGEPRQAEGAPGGANGAGVNNPNTNNPNNGGLVIPSQPDALVPETNVSAEDGPAKSMKLDDGANVEELVNGLHAIGTNAQDVVAILQAIKAAGGLQADLEVQ